MRHRRKGRHLGRSSSHRKALMKNLACALILTERDDFYYEGLYQADGETEVKPPRFKGRITTTLHKAKEVRPFVEKCVTIAKKAIPHEQAAAEYATDAEPNTAAWKTWRESENYAKWNAAMAPAVSARRRVFSMLRDKLAVQILFDEIAPRFVDRNGGYTRILKLAKPRLGDAGAQAILEFVGKHDRVKTVSEKPSFADDDETVEETTAVAEEPVVEQDPPANDDVADDAEAVAEETSEEASDEEPTSEEKSE